MNNLSKFIAALLCSISIIAIACVDPVPATNPSVPPVTVGTTYHVRTDGGNINQCNGKVNAAYIQGSTSKDCAWSNPMQALPAYGTPKISGGDTLIIHQGQYKVGYGATSGAEKCNIAYSWDCQMLAIPSGPDQEHPTVITGQDMSGSCQNKPTLWGSQRAYRIIGLEKSSNVRVQCLEITDKSSCVDGHSKQDQKCNRTLYPYGDWSPNGINAYDSSNVTLKDLDIHGLAINGINAGRLKDWTLQSVRIAANGWAGWNGDIGSSSSNSGTIKLSKVIIEWNGCAETVGSNPSPTACWGQSAGGYGDGLGTAATGGNWIIEDSKFLHNTSDGLDLLYANGTGSVTLDRVWAEGNAGNQIKIGGPSLVQNTVVVGNCGFFDKQSFTFNVDNCRANGDSLAFSLKNTTDVASLVNSTFVSQGNVAILVVGPVGSKVNSINNILVGKPYFLDSTKLSADSYIQGPSVIELGNIKYNLKSIRCNSTSVLCVDPKLVNDSLVGFNPNLTSESPAKDSGVSHSLVPLQDYFNAVRIAPDRGAVEFK